jgi:hypothetical protein
MLYDAIKTMLQAHSMTWYYKYRGDTKCHVIQFVKSTYHLTHLDTRPLVELLTVCKNDQNYFFQYRSDMQVEVTRVV